MIITSIGLLIVFIVMIIRPELFCQATDEKVRKIVIGIMRIAGTVGMVCSIVIIVMQLLGLE